MTFNPQSGTRHQQHPDRFSTRLTLPIGILCLMGTALMAGCVSSGQYEAEKARALNYQRLLAQEEQRTGQLDTRLQEAQQEIASLGSQNRELIAERDALREQAGRQSEQASAREMADISSDVEVSPDMFFSDPSISELEMNDFSFNDSDFKDLDADKTDVAGLDMDGSSDVGTPTYYTVIKGDTLYRISRIHDVTVEQLKRWNNLTDNIISIGQRLIVSQP